MPADQHDEISKGLAGAPRTVLLANPRGFCAGVRRAIAAVEDAIATYGPPVYVRRAIVHNRQVVERLERRGAIFVQDISAIPEGAVTVLSAHGSAQGVKDEAQRRRLRVVDAVCPLVAKIHSEVALWHRLGRHIVLVGHLGHPEITGTLGQVPAGSISVVATPQEVEALLLEKDTAIAYAIQTTFSVSDAAEIVGAIKLRFADCQGPRSSDICYATTNRQAAVVQIASRCDIMLIVGDRTSSNARRLTETARGAGAKQSYLIEHAADLTGQMIDAATVVGLSAAASAPEEAITQVCRWLEAKGFSLVETPGVEEHIRFKPVSLASLETDVTKSFAGAFAAARKQIDAVLEDAIGRTPGRSPRLAEAMRLAAMGGGKRFRAMLILTVTQMLGGSREQALRAGAAIECVHAQSLVHDDLPCMDDDDFRRGRPTLHRRFDEATAVLAGDALLALAFETLADPRTHEDGAVRAGLVLSLSRAIGQDGLAGGQMMDLYPGGTISRKQLTECQSRKTGALFRFAVEAGTALAGCGEEERRRLDSFAQNLGVLFQLQDDILDETGEPAVAGKALRKDAARGRQNAMSVMGLEGAACEAERLLTQCAEALAPFGPAAAPLLEIARFAARRDH
jgi:(E)-4-hydroxy-3-methyl-but-2-enyl pyrophosphate reductase